MTTLLTLTSKQIWPQVLAVAHLRPNRVFLLHSEDLAESKTPAQRLKRLFDECGLAPKGGARLQLVSDSDFDANERRLDELQRAHQLSLPDCVLNFTGGNKLMAIAAFRWAARRGVRAFYLERRNQLTWFEQRDGDIHTRSEGLDGHKTDGLDPVALVRCQVDASEVERLGQTLLLNEAGRKLGKDELFRRVQSGNDARPWLHIAGEADRKSKEGDSLEFAAAAVLLKLGVRRVQRSLRLKVRSLPQTGTWRVHAEIDLLFTWDGCLWLVDCKDRKPAEDLAEGLSRELRQSGCRPSTQASELLDRIHSELSIGQVKAMKEDLLAVRETGGLLGKIVCVRKAVLPEEVVQYARHNNIAVVQKSALVHDLSNLLSAKRLADEGDIARLVAHFRK